MDILFDTNFAIFKVLITKDNRNKMTKIILDTNIILRHPKVLGLEIPDTTFLIPSDVIEELNIRAGQRGVLFDQRMDLIRKASDQGTISIIYLEDSILKKYINIFRSHNISGADLAIVALAIESKNSKDNVKIATSDREISKIAANPIYKIDILSDVDMANLLAGFKEPTINNDTIQNKISNYEKKEKINFGMGILTGLLVAIVVNVAFNNIQRIILSINIWGTIVAAPILGVALFVFREKRRLSYGVSEFVVGILGIFSLFQSTDFDYSKINFNLDFSIKLIGGLYIMVRGQDNIVKAIKDNKFGLYLKDKFGIGG